MTRYEWQLTGPVKSFLTARGIVATWAEIKTPDGRIDLLGYMPTGVVWAVELKRYCTLDGILTAALYRRWADWSWLAFGSNPKNDINRARAVNLGVGLLQIETNGTANVISMPLTSKDFAADRRFTIMHQLASTKADGIGGTVSRGRGG